MYVFVAVTGRVIQRTLVQGGAETDKEKQKVGEVTSATSGATGASSSKESAGGPGSSTGKVAPKTPRAKGKVTADEDDEMAEDDEAEVGAEDDEEDMDADIAALEAMEVEAATPSKKRGRPATKAKSKAKAKATPKAQA